MWFGNAMVLYVECLALGAINFQSTHAKVWSLELGKSPSIKILLEKFGQKIQKNWLSVIKLQNRTL